MRGRVVSAGHRAQRDPGELRRLPVSKTVDASRLRMAYQADCRELAENKVQEARHTAQALADLPDLRWSMIGHLQTHKTKYVARFASGFQALDSLRVAAALDRRVQREGRALDVRVQVNTSSEPSKYRLSPDDVDAFIRRLPAYSRLRVRGLMTLAVFATDPTRIKPCLVRLRQLRDRLREQVPTSVGAETLSMGMSGDFELAIAEGATVVRVGQAMFGARALPGSHYWPDGGHSRS